MAAPAQQIPTEVWGMRPGTVSLGLLIMDREERMELIEEFRDMFVADESNPMTGGSDYGSSGLPDPDTFGQKDAGRTVNGNGAPEVKTNLLPIALIGMLGVALLVQ